MSGFVVDFGLNEDIENQYTVRLPQRRPEDYCGSSPMVNMSFPNVFIKKLKKYLTEIKLESLSFQVPIISL